MSNNARYVADLTVPDDTEFASGTNFVKAWRIENIGSAIWGDGYHLVFLGGEPMAEILGYPIPPTQPGQTADLTIFMTAPETPGTYVSHWRLQDAQGNWFGEVLFTRIKVPGTAVSNPPGGVSSSRYLADWEFTPDQWRRTIWAITSIFESGSPEGDPTAYQNTDAGIISYGKHQATLQSGTLQRVIDAYLLRSDSPTSLAIQQEYAERIAARDASLRQDQRLKELLIAAAAEPEMSDAQDMVFDQRFFQPAITQARMYNLSSPLGLACLYDTQIQGGLFTLLPQTKEALGGIVGDLRPDGPIAEETFIQTFLDLREQRLLRLADDASSRGNNAQAQALRVSTFRIAEYRQLLQAQNLTLEGDLSIRGRKVPGIVFG